MNNTISVLLTDLYQLSMLHAYYQHGLKDIAVFEFFVRKLPDNRNFLIAAGLPQVLEYLESLHFSDDDLAWLNNRGYEKGFVDFLAKLRFTGDMHAMPEGTVFFANEPIIRITAPLPVAQIVETRIINILQFQTMIASKAIRSKLMAPEKLLVDFGLRRAHGAEAGMMAARANYIAGFSGTSNVLANVEFGIPIYGTMAHSFVEAHESEMAAFRNFATTEPDNVVLLIDTYDVAKAIDKTIQLAAELQAKGIQIKGVRLDSGNISEDAFMVRKKLEHAGLNNILIFSSGNLDEYQLASILDQQAPIDGFGIGTLLDTSADAPYLECAYKLQEYAGIPKRKHSLGKATLPGKKQVYRAIVDDKFAHDVITTSEDNCSGQPLVEQVMSQGARVKAPESLDEIRQRVQQQLAYLPHDIKMLAKGDDYPVIISDALRSVADEADALIKDKS